MEFRQGYELHLWLAVGHLAEAEAELMERWPEHAFYIRQHRILLIEEPTYKVPTLKILEVLCEAMQSDRMPEASATAEDVLPGTLGDAGSGSEGESDGRVSH